MIRKLKPNQLLRLRRAAGSSIEVLSGEVWVTEQGRAGDRLLERGRHYRVSADGLVLVGTLGGAHGAELALRPAADGPAGRNFLYLGLKRLLGWMV